MANLVRNFIKGRMNKSVDERLVPNGEYIDAQNIRMGSTEDSEIGAVENTKGNTQLTTLVYPPTGTALSDNATCLGAYSDGANETMYWFVHDPSFVDGVYSGVLDLIVSYNMRNDLLTYHVVSTSTLNFDPQYLITGIDLVDGLLFFTDDFNPPRRINTGTAYPEPVAFADSGVLGDDILVIKRPPLEPPTVTAVDVVSREDYMEDRFLCFGYRWEYANNEYSATSLFSEPIFESEPFAFTTESYLNEGMVNSVQVCDVTVRTGSSLVKGIDILFKEMDDNIIRVIEKVDKADSALTDNSDYTIQFSKQKIFTILPESEILRLYDNVPRLAKAQTLMGNRIVYGNYLEGYDMVNNNGLSNKLGFNATLVQTPLDNSDGNVETPEYYSKKSLHSNRVYEIGIVYMDEFGRSSTALVAPNNKVELECGDSIFQNQIRVTIPSIMSAPAWARRYKFVIKPENETYETIYTNQNFEFGEDVYFLLEGENAAKVEKGDRYVVKKDTSGAVTSCTYAEVLEKKAYGVGELDDTIGTPIPAVAGTYMKMNPNFTYGLPSGVVNLAPGEQSASTNYPSDNLNTETGNLTGFYPVLVYEGFDKEAINSGSRIRLKLTFTRQGRGDGSGSCEKRTLDFDQTWVVEEDYPSGAGINPIVDWFYDTTNNTAIDDIQAALGFSGDPDEDAPENEVFPSTTAGGPTYGLVGNATKNRMRWYAPTSSDPPQFIVYGAPKCLGVDGLVTSGNGPNRRSTVKAEWTVTRSTDAIVFETEPQPALPDLWYESSQSFFIDQQNGRYYGNVQDQTGTQPAIIDTAFFNCISFGNGVESYKIRDSVKGKPITLGNRVTTTSDERFAAVRRFADLTYSGVINDETNINKLNEFNLGLLNFKPLEDRYGPVEKLFARRTDILTLQEDKISYVLAGKNLLTDATGASVVTSVPEVLGTQVARVEDFGISNNPESFAEWGPHKFFTDAKRGSVIHLYGDGQNEQLTVISENGMRSWFRDEFIESFNTQKLGGYDPYMNEYVLASNDVFLPGEEDCIECNTVQTFLLTPAQQSYCVNLGNITGDVSISYNIIEAADGDEATISTTYPDDPTSTPVVTGPISNASQPAVPNVNKNSIVDNTVGIDIDYTGTERFVLQVQVKCPDAVDLNVRLITVNRPDEARQSIHSEFFWQDGVFVSPLSSTAVTFDYDALGPVISDWQDFTVAQGSNLGPTDGSTVTMIYNRITPDNYTLRASDRFRYLRSDTLYREADIVALLADGDLSEITPAGAQPEYTGDFLMPGTGQYLYLVWDYTDGTPPPGAFLLDTYTGAAAGYSTRRLATSATNLMRIREDAGDTETDIGYDSNNELDTAAIATHCGTANGYVVTWYDQAGSNNATQGTEASQPQIYNGTTQAVITENGKPALDFDGVNDMLDASIGTMTHPFSVFMAAQATYNAAAFPYIYGTASAPLSGHGINSSTEDRLFASASLTNSNFVQPQTLFTDLFNGSSSLMRADGTQQASGNTGTNSLTDLRLAQLADYVGDSSGQVKFQEFLIWNSNESSNFSGIEENINSDYLIYQPTDAPTSGLLATYTGAAAAYSVRQLSDKAILCMRVRRDSDDEERNFGFDTNGDLDSAGIAAFCQTANGYVTRWWDQSTNGNHADQATDTSQPQIYDGTAVITENGKPAVLADSSDFLDVSLTGNSTAWIFTCITGPEPAGRAMLWSNQGSPWVAYAQDGDTRDSWTTSSTPSHYLNGSSITAPTRDGLHTLIGSQSLLTIDADTSGYTTGSRFGFGVSVGMMDRQQEFILYHSDQSSNRTGIETNINEEYLIYQPTDAPTSGLLADYTGAAAAYSVRQLSDKAILSMRVRRDSDDVEQNFGFDSNGDLDTAGIASFCDTANGYVTRWWDQSTNGNHADQATDTSQPQIYDGTAVITENGKPAMSFDGTDDGFELSSLSVNASNGMTVSFVSAATGTGTETMLNVRADAPAGNQIFYQTSTNQTRINGRSSTGGFTPINAPSTGVKNLVVGLWDWQNDNLSGDFDGDAATSASGLTEAVTTIDRIRIGQDSGLNFAQFNLNECILWPDNTITIADLSDDTNTYFNIP